MILPSIQPKFSTNSTFLKTCLTAKIYKKWPAPGRHGQDLAKTAKDNIAATINKYNYSDFLKKRIDISKEIANKISLEFSDNLKTDVRLFARILISYCQKKSFNTKIRFCDTYTRPIKPPK